MKKHLADVMTEILSVLNSSVFFLYAKYKRLSAPAFVYIIYSPQKPSFVGLVSLRKRGVFLSFVVRFGLLWINVVDILPMPMAKTSALMYMLPDTSTRHKRVKETIVLFSSFFGCFSFLFYFSPTHCTCEMTSVFFFWYHFGPASFFPVLFISLFKNRPNLSQKPKGCLYTVQHLVSAFCSFLSFPCEERK